MENILLQKDNEKLKQEIDDQNFYIDDLIKENQNLEDDNEKQKTKLIEYEEKISYLTSEHESNLNWIQNLQKKDTEFEEDLSQYILDLNKKGEQLDDANQKQETMIYQLKQEKQQNLGQLIEYNKKLCSLAEEHKNHISLMHSLEKNNSQQKIDVDKLYKQFLKLQRKQEKTDAINSDLTKEVSELYDTNYKIRKNLKKSKKRVFNLTNKQNNYIKITRKYAKKENGQIEKYQTLHMMYRIAIECVEDEKKEKERMIEQIEQKRVEERKTFKKSEADVIDTSLKMLESKEKTIKVLEDELKASQKKIEKLELEKNTLSDELKDTRAQISENLNNLQKMITLNSELKKRKFKMKKLLKKTTEEYRIYKKSLFLRKKKTRSMPGKPLETQNMSIAFQPDVDVDHIQPVETHSANKSGEEAAAVSSAGHVSGLQRNGSAVTSTGGEPYFSANLCETFNIKELNEVDKTLSKYTSNAHLVIIPNQKLSYPKIMKLKNEYRIEIDQHLTEIHLTGKYKSVGRVVNILKHDEKKRCVGVAPDFKIVPTLDFSQISPHTVEAMMKYFKEKENITVTQKENFCTFEEITVKKFRTFLKSF